MQRTVNDWLRLSVERAAGLAPQPTEEEIQAQVDATEPDGCLRWALGGAYWILGWVPEGGAPDTLARLAARQRAEFFGRGIGNHRAKYAQSALEFWRGHLRTHDLDLLVTCYNCLLLEWHQPFYEGAWGPISQPTLYDDDPEPYLYEYLEHGSRSGVAGAMICVLRAWLRHEGQYTP